MTREEIEEKIVEKRGEIRQQRRDVRVLERDLAGARSSDHEEAVRFANGQGPMRSGPTGESHVFGAVQREKAKLKELEKELYELQKQRRAKRRRPRTSAPSEGPRFLGAIKWFNTTKNFGFIKSDGSDGDVFVHGSGFVESGQREEGMRVSFKRVKSPKGFQAVDVRYVSE